MKSGSRARVRIAISLGTAVVMLLWLGSSSGLAFANPVFDGTAIVSKSGKRVLVQGWLPKCRVGAVRSVSVTLNQSGNFAKGNWKGRCKGSRQAWSAVLATGGVRIVPGRARVRALVGSRLGKQHSRRSVRDGVRLRTKSGALPGDRPIMVGVTFDLPVGSEVYIEGGGDGAKRSRCTRDETVERFTSDGSARRVLFQFVAKDGGGCGVEASYNQVWVEVDGPGSDEPGGFFWLGQKAPGQPYFASCKVRVENVFDSYDWINAWDGLKCSQPNDWELKVTLP